MQKGTGVKKGPARACQPRWCGELAGRTHGEHVCSGGRVSWSASVNRSIPKVPGAGIEPAHPKVTGIYVSSQPTEQARIVVFEGDYAAYG